MWGVRKACADVFMPVSCVCSPTVRQTELSPLFINLLRDQSRWVRMAAFQALGPFISTFADPAITALLHNENGEIVITDPDQLAERLQTLEKRREEEEAKEGGKSSNSTTKSSFHTARDSSKPAANSSSHNHQNRNRNEGVDIADANLNIVHMEMDGDSWAAEMVSTAKASPEETRAEKYMADSSSSNYAYSSFLYWRDPVPDIDLVNVDLEEDISELEQLKEEFGALMTESSTEPTEPEIKEELTTKIETETKTDEEVEDVVEKTDTPAQEKEENLQEQTAEMKISDEEKIDSSSSTDSPEAGNKSY